MDAADSGVSRQAGEDGSCAGGVIDQEPLHDIQKRLGLVRRHRVAALFEDAQVGMGDAGCDLLGQIGWADPVVAAADDERRAGDVDS